MQTFSLLIAWDDDDTEQGEYGTIVRATSIIEAERMARAEMRMFHQENDDDDGEEHMQSDGTFGGRLIEAAPGAIWKAQDLENALRAMVATELSRWIARQAASLLRRRAEPSSGWDRNWGPPAALQARMVRQAGPSLRVRRGASPHKPCDRST